MRVGGMAGVERFGRDFYRIYRLFRDFSGISES